MFLKSKFCKRQHYHSQNRIQNSSHGKCVRHNAAKLIREILSKFWHGGTIRQQECQADHGEQHKINHTQVYKGSLQECKGVRYGGVCDLHRQVPTVKSKSRKRQTKRHKHMKREGKCTEQIGNYDFCRFRGAD